jgi:hypothetical protein
MNRSLKDFLADQLADDGTLLATTGRLSSTPSSD